MSIDNIKTKITEKLQFAPPINAKVKLDFKDDGSIFIDATQTPPVLIEEADAADLEADLTLTTSVDTFEGIVNGTQDPNFAFMMGKLKVKGSMGLAMKLNSILED